MNLTAIELDLRGLRCPLPVLRTEKQLRAMGGGDRLSVLSDDPLASLDIPHLCHQAGHVLVSSSTESGYQRFVIERTGMVPSSE